MSEVRIGVVFSHAALPTRSAIVEFAYAARDLRVDYLSLPNHAVDLKGSETDPVSRLSTVIGAVEDV